LACISKRRGKWIADWRDGAGVRHWKTFETKLEAEDFLDQERPKSRQWSQSSVPTTITVKAYGTHWLDLIESVVKPRTLVRYEQLLKRHINLYWVRFLFDISIGARSRIFSRISWLSL
jgi:hypothetical protein